MRDLLKIGVPGPEMVVIPAGRFRMGAIFGGGDPDEKQAERQWNVTAKGAPGKLGIGGGTKGGWMGVQGGKLRFLRLQYECTSWDDGMTAQSGNADKNLLRRIREDETVSFPVATEGEKITIDELRSFKRNLAPPFVFMTGEGSFRLNAGEKKILSDYLFKEGGMLFATPGDQRWARSFEGVIAEVCGRPMLTVAKDDEIHRLPYELPNGIDHLWQHGGRDARGIREGRRWAVYYHPGDINDAWKDGASGLDAQKRENAFVLANNVIFHAFKNYVEAVMKRQQK
mgnify:CR=1 FL=1